IFFAIVRYFASGLIINSKISFDLSNILELDGFSILGFLMMALMMGFCFIVFRFAAEIIRNSFLAEEWKKRYALFISTLILFMAIEIIFADALPDFDFADLGFLFALALLTEIILIRGKHVLIPRAVVFLALFSLYASMLVSGFNSKKQDEN